ncbi:MAG: GLPGLI family protein [Sediminibacterium sp.]|nr:GLPGLI family protein [Sediminibacterium sp.]
MKKYICILSTLLFNFTLLGQEIIHFGKITFEKKINVHKDIEGSNGEQFKSTIPKYQVTYLNLFFDNNSTYFEKATNLLEKIPFIYDENSIEDKIWVNLSEKKYKKQQHILQDVFVIQDSCIDFNWKLTNETRNIAGFECYRAETIINDSVFVIAFYTDKINVSGGPFYFNGLPGMILGIVVPRLNLTLFASAFEYKQYKLPNSIIIDKKNFISQSQLRKIISEFISSRNNFPSSVFLRWLL